MARPNAGDLSRAALERLRDTAGCASEAPQKSASSSSRVPCSVEPVCTMSPVVTPEKTSSVLKPLEELTDADITQLTREDCRKYLKARGMRRPSWNKAQAIEQVRSLRSLFGSKPQDSPSSEPPSSSKQNGIRNHVQVADAQTMQFMHKVSQQTMPHCLSTDSDPAASGAFGSPFPMYGLNAPASDAAAKTAAGLPPPARPGRSHTAQLTIFYSGIVNVYDDVPLEKAQAIMLLAGSKTFHVPSPIPCMESSTLQCPPPIVHAHAQQATAASAGGNNVHGPFANLSEPAVQQEETDPGLPQARTASLQRFLAKRRERITANPPYRRCEKVKRRKSSVVAAAAAAAAAAGAGSSIPNGHHHQLLHKPNEYSMTSKSSGSSDTSGGSSMPSTTTRGTSFSNAESGAGDGKIGGELEDASSIRTRIDYFGKSGAGGAARTPEEVVSAI